MENRLYPKAYGAWAGNERGAPPDYARCCQNVWSGYHGSQCERKRGHGPDKAYCKQHDPDAVEERKRKKHAAWVYKQNMERPQWYGRTFLAALEKNAAGHNDARGLAQEVIAEFKKGEIK